MDCFTVSNPFLPLLTGCSVIPQWSLASRSTYWQSSPLSFSPCHAVTSRCPSLSLWLCPTLNRSSWSTPRRPPYRPARPASPPPVGPQGALPPGRTTSVQTRGWPSVQRTPKPARTSSTWNRELPFISANTTSWAPAGWVNICVE